jgi:hypothetical protein
MHLQVGTIRIEFFAFLGLALLLSPIGAGSTAAQTPAPTQAAAVGGAATQQPLPAIDELIRQVTTQQRASRKTIQRYTYRTVDSEQDLDSHGTVEKTTTKEVETICVDVRCYQKLLAEDGKPLSDDRAKRQNDEIDRENAWLRECNERKAAGLPPPPPLKIKESDQVGDSNSNYASYVGRFLQFGPQLGSFSNLRRVELKGRETIAMDYLGNPHAKASNPLDGVFSHLAGTVWVDERDRALVRIEGRVFEDYKIGGGLLIDIHKGATLQMEWTKVNDEVWLPAAFSGRGSARVLVFAYESQQLDQHWSEYRKFRTTSTILPVAADATKAPDAANTQP